MRAVTIYWYPERDLTAYKWSPQFEIADRITKLDILQDAIADLTERYNKEINNE